MWFMNTVTSLPALLLHHSESVDPTLVEWIKDEIDAIFGVSPTTIVVVLGAVTLAFPIGLMVLALRRARKMRGGGS
jgi:hypothetical protein